MKREIAIAPSANRHTRSQYAAAGRLAALPEGLWEIGHSQTSSTTGTPNRRKVVDRTRIVTNRRV
jgi:hypothetical protein